MKTNFKRNVGIILTVAISLSLAMPAMMAISTEDVDTQYYLLKFNELPSSQLRNAMTDSGIEFQDYYQDGIYLVKMIEKPSDNIFASNYAANFEPYTPEMKINKEVMGIDGPTNVQIVLHDGVDVQATVNQLETMGVTVRKVETASINIIRCTMTFEEIIDASELDDVNVIGLDPEPVAFMDLITSNTFMGLDTTQSFGFTGDGILAEVQDNGIDIGHPDLANVIYTDGTVADDDHGTCTSGIVFGNGAGDIKALGIAYEAVGVFADWGTGRATSINNLWAGTFNQGNAGMNGVVQSNSWSSGTQDGDYGINAAADDAALFDNPKVLSLWANGNGNDGTAEGDLSEDACAKNVMGIGAIFHKDTATLVDDEWLLQSQGNTPSRGPASDGRQKPEMCAPFDWIYTVDNRVGGYATGDYYDNFGGTSGATPIVAGSSVIAYDMYQANFFDNNPTNALPYSSTIKALMVANAYQYDLADATRNEQGWGTPDMENMYNLGAAYHQIDEYPQALDSGDSYSRQVYADGTEPLKISLAWIDPAAPGTTIAARALINNLDLKVTSPGGAIYYGNNGLWTSLYSASGTGVNQWSLSSSYRDDLNNLENVFIQNPQSGIWTIEVSGRTGDVAQGPQDFSLVASGGMIPITSQGIIDLDQDIYAGEDTALVQVMDSDLNTYTNSIQTVTVNVKSNSEPAGENIVLTETGFDTAIFQGTITISKTNSAGVLYVSHGNTVTATYNDANDGSGPATVTDTALIDAGVATPAIQSVEWWGVTNTNDVTVSKVITTGTSSTSHTATSTQDDGYDQTAEVLIFGGGQKYQLLMTYTINIDPTGVGPYTLYCDAYTSAEAMVVTYSVNGGAYQTAFTVSATSDSDAYQTATVTGATPGSVITVRFDDAVDERTIIDNVYVDHLFILGGSTSNPTDHNTVNWTLSADDGAGANDVVQYNIYRANNPAGPWTVAALIDNVPAGENTYTDLYKGQIDGIQWYYVVRGEDILGNEDTNVVAVPEPGGSPLSAYNIPIPVGAGAGDWVFVSFPYVKSGNIVTLLDDANGDDSTHWDIAKWYDSSTQSWKTYSTLGAGMSTLSTITQSMGIWLRLVNNGGDHTITTGFVGDYSGSSVDITLNTGWNMVGYPSASSQTAQSALSATSATWVATYQATAPYVTDTSALNTVTMSEGNAYWVYVTSTSTWTLDP